MVRSTDLYKAVAIFGPHYSTERNLSSHYSTERNGTNTFFAGENITACDSNPMNPTEYPSNKLSFIRIRRVVNDQNVHKTV